MRKAIDHRALDDARHRGAADLLRRQHGIIHRAQALAAGITKQQLDEDIRRKRFHRIAPCILSTTPTPTGLARIWAASLWAGKNSVIAGEAALAAAGLIGTVPDVITVYVDPDRSHRPPAGIRTVRARLPREHFRWTRGLRVTTSARTALDLARWRAQNDHIPLLLRVNAVTAEHLTATLARMTACRGHAEAFRAVQEALLNPWSPPERDLHAHLAAAGISGWEANVDSRITGRTVTPDLIFRAIKLAIEVEGAQFHSEAATREAFERDAVRRQALERAGWFVLRFTPRQIRENPGQVIDTILAKIVQLCALCGVPESFYLTRAA